MNFLDQGCEPNSTKPKLKMLNTAPPFAYSLLSDYQLTLVNWVVRYVSLLGVLLYIEFIYVYVDNVIYNLLNHY